ncbi:MAG TPA: hypothetical protein DCE41_27300 [Cytophagales bacterium]|nr:hypothetical protein [Cytophagales bacterium]HAA21954.1 hypothetical protein [Cytophagales bacterium]HAP61350.1 hypothetical protein [Cytophagales bacterium]
MKKTLTALRPYKITGLETIRGGGEATHTCTLFDWSTPAAGFQVKALENRGYKCTRITTVIGNSNGDSGGPLS